MSTKLQRIKTMLSELLELEMASATSDKGIIYWNDDELKEGTAIYVQDDNDIKVLAEDGDYEVDGKIIKIAEGKVLEITDKIIPVEIIPADDPETPEDETPEMDEEEKPEEEEPSEEKPEEKPADDPETPEDETPEMEDDVENPTNEGEESDAEAIVKIREEVNELYSIIDQLKKEIEELKGKPLAMSAVQELENIKKEEKNIKGVGRYASAIAEMRK